MVSSLTRQNCLSRLYSSSAFSATPGLWVAIGTMTTWIGATAGGSTRPLLSPWVMMMAPMMRLDMPQDVWNGYWKLLSRAVYLISNARENPSPKKWLVPLCSALPSCMSASMV